MLKACCDHLPDATATTATQTQTQHAPEQRPQHEQLLARSAAAAAAAATTTTSSNNNNNTTTTTTTTTTTITTTSTTPNTQQPTIQKFNSTQYQPTLATLLTPSTLQPTRVFRRTKDRNAGLQPTLHDCPSSCPEVSVPHSATWQMWPSMAESWEPSGGSLCLRMLFVFLVIHACQECPLWPKPSDFSVFSPWNDVFSG